MSPCATRHQLQRFLDAEPGCRDDEAIAAHLEGCPACERVLEALVAGRESAPRRERADERDAALIDRITRSGPWQPGPRMAAEGPGQRHGEAATWPVPDSPPLPAIPGFRILREIGRGGMGVVYEAEDQQLNRRVALKVLATHTLNQPNQVQRFDREARAAARLHHSHIVPVFGVGHQNGCHYYAMQYIEGVSLDRVIDELRKIRDGHDESGRSPSASECPGLTALMAEDGRPDRGVGRIGLQVAEALRYAHAHGVLHRDIKPSNLLLDASGNVWLADFGLAKAPEAEDLTGTGDVLGTIRYMAPERFRGRYDERSDVYGLGSTLYELVALRPAFEAADRFELIEEVRRAEPVPLSKRAPDVSRDLETIIHKAIEPEPDRRYAGAGALAEDLRRFLEDRPIRARRVSIPGRLPPMVPAESVGRGVLAGAGPGRDREHLAGHPRHGGRAGRARVRAPARTTSATTPDGPSSGRRSSATGPRSPAIARWPRSASSSSSPGAAGRWRSTNACDPISGHRSMPASAPAATWCVTSRATRGPSSN